MANEIENTNAIEPEYEEMYQEWLAELENRYDCEDATMHHYF